MKFILTTIFIFVLLSSFATASYILDETDLELRHDFIVVNNQLPDLGSNLHNLTYLFNYTNISSGMAFHGGEVHAYRNVGGFPYTGNFSIMFKMNLSDSNPQGASGLMYIGLIFGGGGWSRGFRFYIDKTLSRITFQGGNGTTTLGATTAYVHTDNYLNAVITNNKTGTNNEIKIYLDGQLVRTNNITGNFDNPVDSSGYVYYATETGGIGGYLIGDMNDIRTYTRVVTQEEIQKYSERDYICKRRSTDTDFNPDYPCILDEDIDLNNNNVIIESDIINYGNITNSNSFTNKGSFINRGRYN